MEVENKENTDQYAISADPSKYVTLPVQHDKIWRKYQCTLDWFWTIYDVCLSYDYDNYLNTFDEEQRQYILNLIAFMYATHYTTMNKELFMQFINQVDIKEASYYFGSQADAKKTHSMMYSILLDELIRDQSKKDKLLGEIMSTPSVRDLLHWAIHSTISSTRSFSQRLLAFATIQGIIFSGTFVLLKWIQKQHPSLMPGLSKSNDLIWRDERLNLSFSCMLFEYIDNELTAEEAHKIVGEAVGQAKQIFTKVLPVSTLGMDCDLMEQFLEHSADRLLSDIKLGKLYHKESPFDWIEEPETDTYQAKVQMNNVVVDMSASFGDAKFDTDQEF